MGEHEPLREDQANWRHTLHEVIFEADTPAGKAFDLVLLLLIVASMVAVMLESVAPIAAEYGAWLRVAEWVLTLLFTLEYAARLLTVRHPLRFALSFYGLVDLAAVVPTYLSLLIPGAQSLLVIRALRLLRVFRVLKLVRFLGEAGELARALKQSREKVIIFLGVVLTVDLIVGTLMYLIEGEASGFDSIPRGFYWAIVTMTTVGFGDIAPVTPLGQSLAALVMILGYGIIAVPTGIVTSELARARKPAVTTQACRSCMAEDHDPDAKHCKHCGERL
ncbi:MAG: ion transporter [Deltaproteobacteria bacterium]|nr:ion transporter [Deltaproteobacteria bacterium]